MHQVGFLSLPVEIIQLIGTELRPPDLLSLRRVCRKLHNDLIDMVGRICFSTISTDLSRESLGGLLELSQHEGLRIYPRTLRWVPSYAAAMEECNLGHIALKGYFGRYFDWNRHHSGHLVRPMEAIDILHRILTTGLERCRSFELVCEANDKSDPKSWLLSSTDAFAAIIMMLVDASESIHSLHLAFGESLCGWHEDPRLEGLQDELSKGGGALVHLQELSIHPALIEEVGRISIGSLIAAATNLRKLTVIPPPDSEFTAYFFHSGLSFRHNISSSLEELNISPLSIREADMFALLQRISPTLRVLSLQCVDLKFDRTSGSPGSWSSTFKKLGDSNLMTLVEDFTINNLLDTVHPDASWNRFNLMFDLVNESPDYDTLLQFREKWDKKKTIVTGIQRKGCSCTAEFWDRLARAVKPIIPTPF